MLTYNDESDEELWLMRAATIQRRHLSRVKKDSHRHKNNSRGAIAIIVIIINIAATIDACVCSTISLIFHNMMRYLKFIILSFLVTGVRSLPSGQHFRTDQCHMHTLTQTPKPLRTQTHASCFFLSLLSLPLFLSSVQGKFSNSWYKCENESARANWMSWTEKILSTFRIQNTNALGKRFGLWCVSYCLHHWVQTREGNKEKGCNDEQAHKHLLAKTIKRKWIYKQNKPKGTEHSYLGKIISAWDIIIVFYYQ